MNRRRNQFIRAARVGIHSVRPNNLRHSLRLGPVCVARNTRLVNDVLGHSDTLMTERYTPGDVLDALRFAMSRFEERLGAPSALVAAQNCPHAVQKLAPKPRRCRNPLTISMTLQDLHRFGAPFAKPC